jgi:PAS domain S-box-containing protein
LPVELLGRWQGYVELVARLLDASSVLITRLRKTELEVLVASQLHAGAHERGTRIQLETGHFCEEVFRGGTEVFIADARKEARWANNPCFRQGLISYRGIRLLSPEGEPFGALCALDDKPDQRGEVGKEIMRRLGEQIEMDLRLWGDLERSQHEVRAIRRDRDLVSAVLDTADALVVLLDTEGRIRRFNRACERATKYRSDEVLGRPLWDVLLLPEEVESVKGVFANLRSGFSPNRHENYWLARDGERRLIAWSNTILVDAKGEVEFVVGTGIDVTEERKAQQERERAKEHLYQAERMEAVSRLAAGVAHDFNNLLMVILSCSGRLQQSPEMDRTVRKSLLGSIDQAARQASGVIRSLLTLGQDVPMERRRVVLAELIGESRELLRSSLPANISLVVDVSAAPSVVVSADRTQLQQVLINLAINAGDAMSDGGVLTITLRREGSGGGGSPAGEGGAVIAMHDTGTGMPPEVRARMFEPFFTTKASGRGTGLGLAIVESIVKAHEGQIRVDSRPGRGTTFEIILPCVTDDRAGEEHDRPPSPGRNEYVLLLESSARIRGVIGQTLQQAGYRVIPVADPAGAEARLSQDRAVIRAVVVDSDHNASLEPGWIAKLRTAGCNLPVVVIDGSETADGPRRNDPTITFLDKPFYLADLVKTINRILKKHQVEEEVSP